MSKIKIGLAVLAVIGLGSIVNCSGSKANKANLAPSDGIENPAPAGDDGAQKSEAQQTQEQMDALVKLNRDLQKITNIKVSEEQCSEADKKALVEEAASPVARIKNAEVSERGVILAVKALVNDLRNSENQHCSLAVAADIAGDLAGEIKKASEAGSQENLTNVISRASIVNSSIKPLVYGIQSSFIRQEYTKNWNKALDDLETKKSEITQKIAIVRGLAPKVAANFVCEAYDNEAPCIREGEYYDEVVKQALKSADKAEKAVARAKINGVADDKVFALINELVEPDEDLTAKVTLLTSIVKTLESEREAERVALAKAEAEAKAKAKAEAEAKAKAEAERAAEAARIAKIQAEKAEAERIAQAKAEAQAQAEQSAKSAQDAAEAQQSYETAAEDYLEFLDQMQAEVAEANKQAEQAQAEEPSFDRSQAIRDRCMKVQGRTFNPLNYGICLGGNHIWASGISEEYLKKQ